MPYMSMTAKTVVGKFEAATPCGEKIENVKFQKISGLMSSPEKIGASPINVFNTKKVSH